MSSVCIDVKRFSFYYLFRCVYFYVCLLQVMFFLKLSMPRLKSHFAYICMPAPSIFIKESTNKLRISSVYVLPHNLLENGILFCGIDMFIFRYQPR